MQTRVQNRRRERAGSRRRWRPHARLLLAALAVTAVLQGPVLALVTPDALAWDARHGHATFEPDALVRVHTHAWDEQAVAAASEGRGERASEGPEREMVALPAGDGGFLAAMLVPASHLDVPQPPALAVRAGHVPERASGRVVLTETPPPRSLA